MSPKLRSATSMKMHTFARRIVQYTAPLAAVLLLAAPWAFAQDEPEKRIVSVTGEGLVRVEPDMATVRFGVVSVADDPETAREMNAEASSAAMNAVRSLGIEERYIRLETLRLQPHREWVDDRRRYEERGYEAIRQIVLEVHDLEQLPTLVANVVEQGANRLDQVTYDLHERDQARNDALREAVTKARDKAALVAETLGVELGSVQSVNEQSFDFPRPMYRAETMSMDAAAAAPEPDAYAAGELEVRVTVNVSFELQ